MRFVYISMLILMLFLTTANSNMFFEVFDEEPSNQKTRSTANIILPNFDVLHADDSSKTVTVLLDAKTPENYQGSLLRLHSEDITDLNMVIRNLNIEEIVTYEKNLYEIIKNQNPSVKVIQNS